MGRTPVFQFEVDQDADYGRPGGRRPHHLPRRNDSRQAATLVWPFGRGRRGQRCDDERQHDRGRNEASHLSMKDCLLSELVEEPDRIKRTVRSLERGTHIPVSVNRPPKPRPRRHLSGGVRQACEGIQRYFTLANETKWMRRADFSPRGALAPLVFKPSDGQE